MKTMKEIALYVFYALHNHSNLTELLWKFDNTRRNNAMSAVRQRGTKRCARLSGMVSGNMEINEILRCICMNGTKVCENGLFFGWVFRE
jgi:hypothetical protein